MDRIKGDMEPIDWDDVSSVIEAAAWSNQSSLPSFRDLGFRRCAPEEGSGTFPLGSKAPNGCALRVGCEYFEWDVLLALAVM